MCEANETYRNPQVAIYRLVCHAGHSPRRDDLRPQQRPEGVGRAACRVGTALVVEPDRGRQGHLFQADGRKELKMQANDVRTKAAVSVAEMAQMVGLSRARFYQLVGTTFPSPRL